MLTSRQYVQSQVTAEASQPSQLNWALDSLTNMVSVVDATQNVMCFGEGVVFFFSGFGGTPLVTVKGTLILV